MDTKEAIARSGPERLREEKAFSSQLSDRAPGIAPAGKKGIVVLTPTLGQVSMFYHAAMLDLLWPMNMSRGHLPMMDPKGGQVGQMRNRLVSMAFTMAAQNGTDPEGFLWVDDDVIITRLALLQLVQHDRDIVSGVYFSKCEISEPLIFSGPGSGSMQFKPDQQFEAWGWAQGLSYVRASVYRRMQEELDLGTDDYGNPCWYKQPDFGVRDGEICLGGTEDFHFFDNANKLGYRALVDCSKHAFGFHYDAATKTGYPRKQWDQWLRREPIIWPLKEGGEVVWG